MNDSWRPTGNIKPRDLTSSRLQLHYAIQFMAAVGSALAEPLPDFSHTSLEWSPDLEVFMGVPIRAVTPYRVALDPISLTSILLDKQGDTIASLPLHQQTLPAGLDWLKSEIPELGVDATQLEGLALPSYPPDFPDHAIARGEAFDANQNAVERQELTHYYANTQILLQELVEETEDASPIHIWPHHFDMATLISLPGRKNGELMTIGIGLSPGDSSYDEPYWYVSPYPYPKPENLPPLSGDGFWHTQGWIGAILTASQLPEASLDQPQQVQAFLQSAWEASRFLLKSEPVTFS